MDLSGKINMYFKWKKWIEKVSENWTNWWWWLPLGKGARLGEIKGMLKIFAVFLSNI